MAFDAELDQTNQTKLLLQRARDIQAQGHLKERLWDDDHHSRCMLGSIYDATRSSHIALYNGPANLALIRALGFVHPSQVAAWNNARERTLPQVLARFDAAIERL